jgi:hypothetical protein
MGPQSYILSVVDRKVVMQHMTVRKLVRNVETVWLGAVSLVDTCLATVVQQSSSNSGCFIEHVSRSHTDTFTW